MTLQPETDYTKIGDDYIAYQIVGDGPVDLVYVAGLSSQIDLRWDFPPMARFLEKLASFSRLIMFDRRGFGASDPVPSGILTWEEWADDLRTVMDAAGSERAVIFGENDVSPTALLFSATFPDRVSSMIIANGSAKYLSSEGYDGLDPDTAEVLAQSIEAGWGRETLIRLSLSSLADDMHAIRTVARQVRASTTPGRAAAQYRYLFEFDLRDLLPSIHVPTLVIARSLHPYVPAAAGRYMAEHIEGARYAEFPGSDFWCCTEGAEDILDVIEEFLTGAKPVVEVDRVLATVLFTDIVGSTTRAAELGDRRWKEMLDRHDQLTRSIAERFGGRIVKTTGDGALATFDSPGRAIRCAGELNAALKGAGIAIRAGLHTGEVELRGEDVGGIAVHIGARVMGEARPGEVLCSRTVKDLVVGSGLSFVDRGSRTLRGVPDEWQLFAVGI
ncbi:MAG TPA: adenylate/guanylate cyclase domain-containing protein [Actinomycetota bacterium]|nr:adenylate/guanylate cyclase domain-containing protein [Actinomycetota bacterium]